MKAKAAYIVKTRATGWGPRRAARYPGEPRPKPRWRTRRSHPSLEAAQRHATRIYRQELLRVGPALVEVAIFHRGRIMRPAAIPDVDRKTMGAGGAT